MGRTTSSIAVQEKNSIKARSHTVSQAERKNSIKAHLKEGAEAEGNPTTKSQFNVVEEEEEEGKNSIKAQSYTSTGTSRGDLVMASFKAAYKDSLKEALQRADFNFVLTDPRLQDNPIVYASDGFLEMTGYVAEEVLGRNCRFLQGPGTDRHAILQIRDAIREERACQVAILNYTKHGNPFWNLFHMAPVYSKEDGRVVHFVGVQTPVRSNSADHPRLPYTLECFCTESSSAALGSHDHHSYALTDASPRDRPSIEAISPPDVDEETCEAGEADKDNAKSSVNSLLNELVSKCKGAGVSSTRCTTVAAGPGGGRVICSSLMLSLTKVQQSFVLANPHLPDTPIVHASELFLHLTGYSREEVVGRNCRFLQGQDTDQRAVQLIRESLKAEKSCTVKLLNYRKDKTPFWNLLYIAPVRSNTGKVAFFVGVQLDATSVEEPCCESISSPHIKQLGAVGAVRVAVRGLQGEGLRRIDKSR